MDKEPNTSEAPDDCSTNADHSENEDFTCLIYGSEIYFQREVPLAEVKSICRDIWDHPSLYSDYKDGSDTSYYSFLKYLWVRYPDNTEKQLADIVAA